LKAAAFIPNFSPTCAVRQAGTKFFERSCALPRRWPAT
jgi:hypothetical protein